jgi:hypothetical protein
MCFFELDKHAQRKLYAQVGGTHCDGRGAAPQEDVGRGQNLPFVRRLSMLSRRSQARRIFDLGLVQLVRSLVLRNLSVS